MEMGLMIKVRNLVKRYGLKSVLQELDFCVKPGEFVALLGPNGAGKTTFLRILSSLTRFDTGDIRIGGYRLPTQASSIRQSLGVVLHQPLLYADLSAEENLSFYGRMYNIAGLEYRIRDVLEVVDLQHRSNDLVRTYSRGMQQRLAIGRAILHDPQVLLLDEPHTGLDQGACVMLDEVLVGVASRGRTLVMTSHDLERAAKLAWRFDILAHGKIIASTTRDDLDSDELIGFYRQNLQKGFR
jgi:heme exporter protein A